MAHIPVIGPRPAKLTATPDRLDGRSAQSAAIPRRGSMLREMELADAPAIFATKRRLGLRKTLAGLDYTRSVEYPVALDLLVPCSARRILEIGSSKLPLALHLASRTRAEVYATDLDPIVQVQSRYAKQLGIGGDRLRVSVEDARHLAFPDGYFDRVISVSTIEHVQAVEVAATEIGRVLSPGGIAVITVPFSRRPRVQFLPQPAYAGTSEQDPTFYEYIFDRTMLFERLLEPTGLTVERLVFLGEPRVRLTSLVYNPVIGRILRPLAVGWPWLARLSYRVIDESQVTDGKENIAIAALRRPA